MPTLKSRPESVDAERYNRARLALHRLGTPLRIILPKLRSLDVILEEDMWAIVDRDLNDMPVAAWTDFEHRSTLHLPVRCILRHYHACADAVIDKALQELDGILDAKLLNTR